MSDAETSSDSVRTWDRYCDAIKLAGGQLLRAEAPKDALNQAEGLRYLSRLVRLGLEMYVESGDMQFPVFMTPSHETAKITRTITIRSRASMAAWRIA